MSDLRVARHGLGWTVLRGSTRVAGIYSQQGRAEEIMENMERRAALRDRPCFTCGDMFKSEGAHNRMCQGCRTRSGDSPYEIGHRRARIGAKA
jgi:hypothetical protein